MKNILNVFNIAVILLIFTGCGESKQPTEYVDGVPQLNPDNIEEIIGAMTTEEKVSLLIGTGMAGFTGDNPVVGQTRNLVPGAAGTTWPIPRLGIPAIVLADGPAGLRIAPLREGDDNTYYCTAFPIATQLASTWDVDLVEKVGQNMGAEVLEYGCDVLLGPGMNLHRNPLCGRNFEYYSEDPLVTGKMAAAMVKGVQSNGVGTSIKHFAVNNQETNRRANDARLSTRALREIYLKGFEIAIKESNPRTIMSSYNKINGTYTSESRDLLTTITRDEWGFQGTVMTDWFGGTDAPAQVYAGNDLLMPGRANQKEDIMKALEDGSLSQEYVDTNVKRILELIVVSPRFRGYEYSNKPDLEAHAQVTRQAGAEGMVLLKNSEALLPLPETLRKVAVFGNTSYAFIAGGTGSGDVNEAYTVSLVEGLENAGFELDKDLKEEYLDYREKEVEKREKTRSRDMLSAFMPQKPFEEYLPSEKMIRQMAQKNDIAFITIGRNSGEFMDRRLEDDFLLTTTEKEMLAKVSDVFHQEGKKVVVILNIGGVIETACWKDLPDAILLAWQGGQEGGNAVADILTGKVNPSGKLTMTFPVIWEDHPSSAYFPTGDEPQSGAPLMAIMQNGDTESERDPIPNVDYTEYNEGVFVGYRAFEHNGTAASYPFGYGLSYTTFQYGEPEVSVRRGVYTVSLDVTNTGKMAGKEVVQLYVSAPGKDMIKPEKELKAFAKTGIIGPGQTTRVEMIFTNGDLASFDEERSCWVTEPGNYRLLIGASSLDIKQQSRFEVRRETIIQAHNVMKPAE